MEKAQCVFQDIGLFFLKEFPVYREASPQTRLGCLLDMAVAKSGKGCNKERKSFRKVC